MQFKRRYQVSYTRIIEDEAHTVVPTVVDNKRKREHLGEANLFLEKEYATCFCA